MENRKKILFFLFGGVGGAELMTLSIATMLQECGHDVALVICGREKGIINQIPDEFRVNRIPWLNIHVFPRVRMALLMLREKPDFVFSSTMQLNVRLLPTARILSVRCIIRNDNMLSYVSDSLRKKVRRTYPYAYRIIAQQEEMQQELIDLICSDASKVRCLHNPVNKERIESMKSNVSPYPDNGEVKILWTGGFCRAKGQDVLLKAFLKVHERHSTAHLYLMGNQGDLSYIEDLEFFVKENNLTDCVTIMGYQPNPYPWIQYCDCFVLPSRAEGLPNALVEAMYLGRPVVATRCVPVIERMVVEGYNGYTIAPENPEEMALAIMRALELKDFSVAYSGAKKESFIQLFR